MSTKPLHELSERDLALETAAVIAESYATCSCRGRFGRCVENDAPLAIAECIRALRSDYVPPDAKVNEAFARATGV